MVLALDLVVGTHREVLKIEAVLCLEGRHQRNEELPVFIGPAAVDALHYYLVE